MLPIEGLFRLFAKELLAPRPFAMCLKLLKFCFSAEGNCLMYFKRNLLLLLTANGLTAGAVAESKERKFIL